LSNGNALPAWLNFTSTTRNFNGTPAAANVGAIDVRVTASDGVASINDVFTLTVNPATKLNPVINWSNPAPITVGTPLTSTQLNATATYNAVAVPGVFTYTPPAGTVLGEGAGQQLSVSFVPADGQVYNSVSKTVSIDVNAATGGNVFYRAINVNGPALTIDGNNWEASAGAPNYSYTTNRSTFQNQSITLVPPTDANRATMIRSSVWGGSTTFTVGAVPAGTYQVWIYVWEDNFPTVFSVSVEGALVLANHNSGGAGVWSKLGPYQATINDGAVNISTTGGDAAISGIEIWRVNQGGGNQSPVVSNPIPNQTATAGTLFNYTFPSNTFSDPDAGTTLSYTASLSNGNALPAWLNFTSTTRNFNGTPAAADVGAIDVRVTASDGVASINDVFTLTVNSAAQASFYRAINVNGPALTIDGNSWEASAGAANYSYTTSHSTYTNQSIPLVPATDASRATMIRSCVWGSSTTFTVGAVPAGTYEVWIYVWEDNFATVFSVSVEGSLVLANYNSGGAGVWRKLGPYQATINDGAVNISTAGGHAAVSGIEIWKVNQGQSSARMAFSDDEIITEMSESPDLVVYPNPSSGTVNIDFTTKEAGMTQVAVFNTRGEQVSLLYAGMMPANKSKSLEVEPVDWVNGFYIVKYVNGKTVKYIKLALAR
jgi:hypothetical protein